MAVVLGLLGALISAAGEGEPCLRSTSSRAFVLGHPLCLGGPGDLLSCNYSPGGNGGLKHGL